MKLSPQKVWVAALLSVLVAVAALAAREVWRKLPRNWTPDAVRRTMDVDAVQVIQGLELNRTTDGVYPRTLIPGVNNPTAGMRSWKYDLSDDGRSYTLTVVACPWGYPSVTYSSETRAWVVDE